MALAGEQVDAARGERDELRKRVVELESELARRQQRVYELQDDLMQLQQQGE